MRNDQQFKGDPAKSEAKNATISGHLRNEKPKPKFAPRTLTKHDGMIHSLHVAGEKPRGKSQINSSFEPQTTGTGEISIYGECFALAA
jgi:hypothetical protein